jgi:hypothetical protein
MKSPPPFPLGLNVDIALPVANRLVNGTRCARGYIPCPFVDHVDSALDGCAVPSLRWQ